MSSTCPSGLQFLPRAKFIRILKSIDNKDLRFQLGAHA